MQKQFFSIVLAMILITAGAQVALLPTALAQTDSNPQTNPDKAGQTQFPAVEAPISIVAGEEFTISLNQKARLTIGQPEINAGYYYEITLAGLSNEYCFDQCSNNTPNASLKINGTPGFISISPQGNFINTEEILLSGTNTGTIGKSFYAIRIENNGIDLENKTATFEAKLVGENLPQPPQDVFAKTGEKFSLLEGQKVVFSGEVLQLVLEKTNVSYCTQAICIDVLPSAKITIISSPLVVPTQENQSGTGSAKQVTLGLEDTVVAFGFTIKANFIEDGKAGFIVTKNIFPNEFKVLLGDKFSLLQGQTAEIIDNGSQAMKVTLEKIVWTDKCVQGFNDSCNGRNTAYLSFDTGNGTIGFYINDFGQKYSIFDDYKLKVRGISESSATLVVTKEPSKIDTIFVQLDNKFGLKEKQTAIIKETKLEIQFLDFTQIYCITTPCPSQAVFLVKDNTNYGEPRGSLEDTQNRGSGSANHGSGSGSSQKESIATKISLSEGSAQEVFGHKITLNSLSFKANEGNAVANLTVSLKETPPKSVTAFLSQKFWLNENQTALVMDNQNNTVMKLFVSDIEQFNCAIAHASDTPEKTSCNTRDHATITAAVKGGESASFLLTEGEQRQIGGYNVRLVKVDLKDNRAMLFVEPTEQEFPYKKVSLDEKFELKAGRTALVAGPDIFLRLNSIAVLKSFPAQYRAQVSVWKNNSPFRFETVPSDEGATEPRRALDDSEQTVSDAIVKKGFFEFSLAPGQSLDVFGTKITALQVDGEKTVFVATTNSKPQIINVFVNEPFTLQTSQTARVVGANLLVSLLGITSATNCPQTFPVTETMPCYFSKQAQIGVSNYLFESIAGKTIQSKELEELIVENQSAQESTIIVPDKFTAVYNLQEGEEVTVNDYSIKAISIEADSAEFVVKNRISGHTVEYKVYSGWNLFSMPGELETLQSTCDSSDWKLFEFNPKTNSFKQIVKPVAGKAYWLYNRGENCSVSAQVRNPITISELAGISKGWNFVAPTFDMVGKKIAELGNCEIKAVYRWDAQSKQWLLTTNLEVMDFQPGNDMGSGFAVYSQNACSLSEEILSPPPLPPIDGTTTARVFYSPIQCNQNPWQEAGLGGTENEMLEQYYSDLGVKVLGYQSIKVADAVCLACSCSTGYNIVLTIGQKDLQAMLGLGWKEFNS